MDVRTNNTQANSIQGSRQPFAVRFQGMTVALCGPIPSEKLTGYELRLVIDKAGAEKFKPFASKYHQNGGQIEVPLSASYEYDGDPKTAYRVLVGDQRVYKGSPLEKLFRHLVKAIPVDERIKKNILSVFEKTQPTLESPEKIVSKEAASPKTPTSQAPPVVPKPFTPAPPVPPSPAFQPQPTAATLIRNAHEKAVAAGVPTGGGNGLERTFFLQDPQHPQAPPVKVSVSVKLGPVTVVTH